VKLAEEFDLAEYYRTDLAGLCPDRVLKQDALSLMLLVKRGVFARF
jgi:hypothetical protein